MPNLTDHVDHTKFGNEFLDDILDWISVNFEPTDIWEEKELLSWFKDNVAMEDMFDPDDISDYVLHYMSPAQRRNLLGMKE